ncbi:1,4-dihydroxy-2-naphthoate polyprenyltransferase [Paenibacillus agilis]|uniref:1,4-dihydroxy-2-naphthoate polyprenyltransferase n=1 Tax=Paenibacillus agilis TaxID=3020863 RepID=A0A559IPS3_9BACL|nr:1,4-dihydroxy-2-naphthoate polyprenyltransferase [Paenibacillus agilis]TVX89647.1 1,4-dihydroxy-2-naphthoate polyprenyltransferase [Paenibacillus agilis]
MTFQSFLQVVELRTKAASMIPFALGSLYALYRFEQFHMDHFLLMLASLLAFDMATTAINNYGDYKKAVKRNGYGYEEHNAIVRHQLSERSVLFLIFVLLSIAIVAGFLLFLQTNLLVLLLGGLSFLVGFWYSLGPIPISRMPLGELFSGLFMGFVIIFISAYVHVEPTQLAGIVWENGHVYLDVNVKEILFVFLISIPTILTIGNIMLANNICDKDEDIENKRYTLPVYIGKDSALVLFRNAYYFSYLDLIVLLVLGIHPLIVLPVLLTIIPLRRRIAVFTQDCSKERTFGLVVKNFIQLNTARIFVFAVAILL